MDVSREYSENPLSLARECLTNYVYSKNLHGLDDNVLNPAIKAVVETLMGAVGKTEEVIKPLIEAVLKPLGLLKENGEKTPASAMMGGKFNTNPEVTYAGAVSAK